MPSLRLFFGENAGVIRDQPFQLVLLAALLVPTGNGLMSPILDSLIDPFGATPANIGLLVSVFLGPSIVIMPIAGMLADRYGRKTILVPSIVVFGLAGAAISLTVDFRYVLALRLLQGIGWACLTPLIVTAVGDFYAGSRETTAQGLRLTGSSIAGGALSLLAGGLVVLAWQFPFLLYLLSVPIAVALYVWFDEPTSDDEPGTTGGMTAQVYRRALFELGRHRRVLFVLIARSLMIMVWIGFGTYNSIIVIRFLDGTPVQAGLLFAVGNLAMAVGASQAGRATALVGNRYAVLVAANVGLGVGFATIALAPDLVIAGVGVTAIGASHGLAVTLYRSLITGFAPESIRAGLVSLGEAGARVMATTTPIAMGAIIAGTTSIVGFVGAVQTASLTISIVAGGGGIILVFIARAMPPVAAA